MEGQIIAQRKKGEINNIKNSEKGGGVGGGARGQVQPPAPTTKAFAATFSPAAGLPITASKKQQHKQHLHTHCASAGWMYTLYT